MTLSLNTDTATDARLTALLNQLTLEEKVQLLTGRDFWNTWPIEKIGLRRILVSDGPSGVRGELWDERSPSLNLPSSTALGAAWDRGIARRYGNVAAAEARRKGVDVVLGPTINLHRSPLGGRHFEAFSEDPVLTSALAVAYVNGVQENGVGATPKHYIANDFETDRYTADVQVSDRALRELYLLAFEDAITEAGAWLVMSSYNAVNGPTVTENPLLETPLNSEWGFDGVVISDWTAVRSIESARHSQDLVMPGPDGPWGAALVAAVLAGDVAEADIDRKVLRILLLAARVGALDGFDAAVPTPVVLEDGRDFAREAETAGSVLVANPADELPWAAADLAHVAVIGHNAKFARTQGGGSATVLPEAVITPLEGVIAALPNAHVTYSVGAVVQEGIAEFALATITNPITGEPGARIRFLDADRAELFVEDRRATALVWFGGDAPIAASSELEFTTRYTPDLTGEVLLGFAAAGNGRIFIDGVLVHEETVVAESTDLGAAFLAPPTASVALPVTEGVPIDVKIEYDIVNDFLAGALAITIGIEPDLSNPDDLIREAVEAARAADVVVLVVGTNSKVESEGFDRSNLTLPGRQDELVAAVIAANPRTVVVVNAGSPVLMPWRNDAAAVLLSWFGGQEYGAAVADMLFGAAEPGGRLPTTWPATLEDVPVLDVTPVDGIVRYDEGIHIGYRAWLKAGTTPAYPFGFGLGYTDWELGELTLSDTEIGEGDTVTVSIPVSNTGARSGKQVVQVYAARTDTAIDRPVRWLVGFASVRVAAGQSAVATVTVPARAFADWQDGWHYEAGAFELLIGTNVDDLPRSTIVTVR